MRYRAGGGLATDAPVLARLAAGQPVMSLGIRSARTAEIARMASGAGFDLVWIDLEHSSMSIDCAATIAAAATDLGLAAWVRVPEREYGVIGRILDAGATGIISPRIETADEARLLAEACRFPPEGQRSAIARLPQSGFVSMSAAELTRGANAAMVVQALIESRRGIDNIDAIAAVPGIDVLGVGTNDLSANFGCPGDSRNPEIQAACAAVAAAAARHGKVAVIGGVADAAHFAELIATGFAPLIFAGIDTDVMAQSLAERATLWRDRLSTLSPANI